MAYIGREPQIGNFQVCDAISTVDAQAAYTMQVGGVNVSPETANHMLVSLNGILQAPTTSYTVSGSTITFAANLVTGDVINFIQILGSVLDLGVPSDATVSTAKIVDGAVTYAKASGFGKLLQVVNAKTNTQFNTTSTSLVAVTNLSAAITPSATSSKVLIMVNFTGTNATAGKTTNTTIYRDSTNLAIQSSTGIMGLFSNEASEYKGYSYHYLDAPSSTSALTYQVYVKTDASGTAQLMVNGNTASITLMEIAG
jgi:hypothetical protein